MKSKVKDLPINNPPDEEIIPLEEKQQIIPKKQVSEQQLLNLAKARERAKERKKELAELNFSFFVLNVSEIQSRKKQKQFIDDFFFKELSPIINNKILNTN